MGLPSCPFKRGRFSIRWWSDGSRSEIKALVEDVFYVDKQENISTNRIPGMRRLAISDEEWR
ncbi:MAG: DUF3164 family protein [Treponema sp.]|nr:DUF3164 family protein [Treponema sp.]